MTPRDNSAKAATFEDLTAAHEQPGGLRSGWRPDPPDYRDQVYSAPLGALRALPPAVDLRPGCPPVYDQGRIGSCTANAIAAAIQFDRAKADELPDFIPSRLFIYYNERAIERSIRYDAGAIIRDGIKVVNKLGACPEADLPYGDTPPPHDGAPFPASAPAAKKPPVKAYRHAQDHQAVSYLRLNQTLAQMQGCLADGYPFVFGFTVYENFLKAPGVQETVTPLPSGSVLGGHAVLAVGYDNAKNYLTVRNSWGEGQADGGYFYMPYAYVTNPQLASDFWTIRAIEA